MMIELGVHGVGGDVVRELSCRLCLCTDVVKLKPLSLELKRKLRKILNIDVRTDDNLPKAICHDCLQQVGQMHRYCVRVAKTQNFLQFYHSKTNVNQTNSPFRPPTELSESKNHKNENLSPVTENSLASEGHIKKSNSPTRLAKSRSPVKKAQNNKNKSKSPGNNRHRESLSLEEFILNENIDETLFMDNELSTNPNYWKKKPNRPKPPTTPRPNNSLSKETLDSVVMINGKPAKSGQALDNQISLFYKMECMVCHEGGFQFKTLMKHYRDRHGVPGYITCCNKNFYYFHPKKIVEHMAYHLQPNIFMCDSCHESFQSSQELCEHKAHGGRSEGRILCGRCGERFPTWRELGRHLIMMHRVTDADADRPDALRGDEGCKHQCDYCGKCLKHHHRKKNVNGMEDLILCMACIRTLKRMDGQIKENKIDSVCTLPKNISFSPLLAPPQ